jgi:hypothetical protein
MEKAAQHQLHQTRLRRKPGGAIFGISAGAKSGSGAKRRVGEYHVGLRYTPVHGIHSFRQNGQQHVSQI